MRNDLTHRVNEDNKIGSKWKWFLVVGILLIVLGIASISSAYYTTVFSVLFFGVFLIAASIAQFIQTFVAPKWSGLFISLFTGILYLVTGVFCLINPTVAAVTITLWIAAFCFIAGLFRMISSLILRFDYWGWVFFNGLVTFTLGLMIYNSWPISGLWIIGLFVGIDLLLVGWSSVLLSYRTRDISKAS